MRKFYTRGSAFALAAVMMLSMAATNGLAVYAEDEDAAEPGVTWSCPHQNGEQATNETADADTDNGCPYCVSAWSWIDDYQVLTSTDNGWELYLPGAGQGNPLTPDALAAMLPGEISGVTEAGDTVELAVVWDLTALPESMTEGTYTLTAALAETEQNYALTGQAAPLSVTMRLGGAETYDFTLPTGDPPYPDHIVQGVSPNGTTINLFDYWVEERTSWDGHNPDNYYDMGINKDHALLFTWQMQKPEFQNPKYSQLVGNWNGWTRGTSPYYDIVQDKLVDGYPALNLGDPDNDGKIAKVENETDLVAGRDGQESLAYLFDPDMPCDGKASHENVQGLLQVDDQGYYYYDSMENYAVYYENTNSFVLYDHAGVLRGNTSSPKNGQFFPFNEANADPDNNEEHLMRTNKSTAGDMNHYFGIHMSTRFIQQNNGHVDEEEKIPVTYEFSGDDDVWIFIDGKLAVDLGGLHNRASVTINFATGEILINQGLKGERETSLKEMLGLNTDTLPDETYHTLDFFYLERGNTDSNMMLRYNLVTIPESDLIKVDQLGDAVEGAKFTLYSAEDYAQNGEKATPIATGTTDKDGGFVFLKEDASGNYYPVTIDQLYTLYQNSKDDDGNNLILVETKTPEGHRSVGAVGLYFYKAPASEEVLLLSNSVWDKGAYAMPKVTATLPNDIQLLDVSGQVTGTVTLTGPDAPDNPLLFAVVYQKQDDSDTWLPVCGDPINGWTVQKDNSWDSILAAALANQYVFQPATSGAYQVEIENLPGDITTYYHLSQDKNKAKYTVAYYYTTADKLENATADTTNRIESDSTEDKFAIERVFSMRLYVPNIKNYLLVQKVDTAGGTHEGATFELYKAEDVTFGQDGTVTVDKAKIYDTLTTMDGTTSGGLELQGGGIFPATRNTLENGEYYLIESNAPSGYKKNDTAIHVVVDNTGVYADAGTLDDGVEVLRGVGSVVKSMVQFSANDKVDTTLNGIKAALTTNVTFNDYNEGGSFTVDGTAIDWDSTGEEILHLQYENKRNTLDYGPYDPNGALTLSTKVGWSKLLIRQCYQHDGAADTKLKQNLGDRDITNLFSGTCTVRVTDYMLVPNSGSLTISKTVAGNGADKDKAWTFTVELKKGDGTAPTGDLEYTGDGTVTNGNGSRVTLQDGKITLQLKHGQSITFSGIPENTKFTVTEAKATGYTTKATGNTGTIVADQTSEAAFVNTRTTQKDPDKPDEPGTTPKEPDPTPEEPVTEVVSEVASTPIVPQTGDDSPIELWVLLSVASLAGLCLAVKKKLSCREKRVQK